MQCLSLATGQEVYLEDMAIVINAESKENAYAMPIESTDTGERINEQKHHSIVKKVILDKNSNKIYFLTFRNYHETSLLFDYFTVLPTGSEFLQKSKMERTSGGGSSTFNQAQKNRLYSQLFYDSNNVNGYTTCYELRKDPQTKDFHLSKPRPDLYLSIKRFGRAHVLEEFGSGFKTLLVRDKTEGVWPIVEGQGVMRLYDY